MVLPLFKKSASVDVVNWVEDILSVKALAGTLVTLPGSASSNKTWWDTCPSVSMHAISLVY